MDVQNILSKQVTDWYSEYNNCGFSEKQCMYTHMHYYFLKFIYKIHKATYIPNSYPRKQGKGTFSFYFIGFCIN